MLFSYTQILYWNHTDLVNSQLDLPMQYYLGNLTQPIALVGHSQDSDETATLTACLSAFYPRWTETLPASFSLWQGNPNPNVSARASTMYLTYEDFGLGGHVVSTPYSLGYIPYPTISQDPDAFNIADMVNRNGDRVTAPPNLDPAILTPVFNSDLVTTQFIDSPAPMVWPIGLPTYAIVRTGAGSALTCREQREMLLFWQWTLTDYVPNDRLHVDGYSSMGSAAHALVLDRLNQITCINTGLPLLMNTSLPQHIPTKGIYGVIASVEILGLIVIIGIGAYLYRDWHKIPPPALFFFLAMLFGAVLNYVSVGWFFMIPSHTAICTLRKWFTGIGFSILFAAIFVRAFQIQSILLLSKSSKILSSKARQVKSLISLVGTFSIIVGVQLVILIIWTSVDPWTSIHHNVDILRNNYDFICSSNHNWIWFGIEIAYFGILLCFGFYVVYRSWDMKHLVIESKYLAISVYNSAVIMIIAIILLSTLPSSDNLVFYVSAGSIGFLTTFSAVAFIGPKLMRITGSKSHSTGTSEMSTTNTHNKHKSKSKESASLV